MIPFEKAFEIIMSRARPLGHETVPLHTAAGRILARDVACDLDMPPFDKSAMDGYACRRADLPGPLRVVETIQAGAPPKHGVEPGECAKIMTGAMVPRGADCVIMVEHTERDGGGHLRFTRDETAPNICWRGEDIHAGEIVLRRGVRLGPQHIAVLATAGCAEAQVVRRPRAGVIATGDELVEPTETPGPGQIRNSNSYQICAHIEQTGALVRYYGIAADTREALDGVIKRAMAENDVLLLSGGVSMGDFDFVPAVLKDNGIEILFDAIAMKPGKPTTFGVGPSVYCFGLPGNPVSTFVQCQILVTPFLYALMAHEYRQPCSQLYLAEDYHRKRADREAWVPVIRTDNDKIRIAAYHGSAHINALSNACGFIVIPRGVTEISQGSCVRVWLI